MAVSVNAQTETPLVLGGGWNAGFAGETDVYDFTISKSGEQQSLPAMSTLQIILSISSNSKIRFLPTAK